MERAELIEMMERLPVAVEVSDEDYRTISVPCLPFPELAHDLGREMAEGADLLEAA